MGRTLPPLAVLAALFALVDLAAVRIILRGSEDSPFWETLGSYAQVPLTIAAIAGCVGITASLVDILRMPPPPQFSHRLSLALFTGVFVPVVAAATFMPRTIIVRDSNFLVHLATLSAGALVVFFSAIAIPRPGPSPFRIGGILLTGTAFAHVFHLSATSLGVLGQIPVVAQLGALAELLGLVCYCLIPLVLGIKAVAGAHERNRIAVLGIGLLVGIVVTGLLVWQLRADPRIERSIAAGLGFHQLSALWRDLPAIVISAFTIVGLWFGLGRQFHAALSVLLLLSAGFSPTAPGYLVMWVLGATLLMRASISVERAPIIEMRRSHQASQSDHDANDTRSHTSGEHAAEHGAQA